jgi:hypothetical protein
MDGCAAQALDRRALSRARSPANSARFGQTDRRRLAAVSARNPSTLSQAYAGAARP